MTIAEKIGALFDNDGHRYKEAEHDLFEICEDEQYYKLQNWEKGATRYEFKDGSAIVIAGECWDYGFEGVQCTCWKEAGHFLEYCEMRTDK